MKALKGFVVLECLDEKDVTKTSSGIYIKQNEPPKVGHFKVLSVGEVENCEIKVGDTVWVSYSVVSNSSNFENEKIGIVKYEYIMSVD